MALEDIAKLKEKVEKDPKSKLFVPLADEYRKAGKIDDAVSVLLKGLADQPEYMSARVSLGKIYLEKKMIAEAKDEFEKVIKAISDNLFAHKKLAEIYRDSGESDRAIAEYKAVLRLNPFDENAVSNLGALQSTAQRYAPEPSSATLSFGEVPEEKISGVGVSMEAVPAKEIQKETAEEKLVEIAERATDEVETIVEEDITVLSEGMPTPLEEEKQVAGHEDEFEKFRRSFDEREEKIKEAVTEDIGEEIISEEEIGDLGEIEKEAIAYVDVLKEPKPLSTNVFEALEQAEEEPEAVKFAEKPGLSNADELVRRGNYTEAMKIYIRLLKADPDDKNMRQKVEELKMLLRMLGKTGDVIIEKLKLFEEGLKRRKDEFLGNS
ncbi:MAG: tetratricopeptide repeat protein [Nitrospirae bacterium]|nr:tetratricopeptide repeat protein [Nitrospirota bacterium]